MISIPCRLYDHDNIINKLSINHAYQSILINPLQKYYLYYIIIIYQSKS